MGALYCTPGDLEGYLKWLLRDVVARHVSEDCQGILVFYIMQKFQLISSTLKPGMAGGISG
jgi:hypothetical protein